MDVPNLWGVLLLETSSLLFGTRVHDRRSHYNQEDILVPRPIVRSVNFGAGAVERQGVREREGCVPKRWRGSIVGSRWCEAWT